MKKIENWASCVVLLNATVKQVIDSLNTSCLQICMILDDRGRLAGILCDGDIRRALSLGQEIMSIEAIKIAKIKPVIAYSYESSDLVRARAKAANVRMIPIVDEQEAVIGLWSTDDASEADSLPNLCVIMAGGRGSRLMPYTKSIPKPMIDIGGKPMLEKILLNLRKQGFRNFVLSVNYLSELIENYFGDGSAWNIKIDYIRELEPLGTAGSLCYLEQSTDAPFIVMNGDILSNFDLGKVLNSHIEGNADVTVVTKSHEIVVPFGVVETNAGSLVAINEKPTMAYEVLAGIYVLNPVTLSFLSGESKIDMPDLILKAISHGKFVTTHPYNEMWIDVGRPSDLERARQQDQV